MGKRVREFGSDFNLCTDQKWLDSNSSFFNSEASHFFLSGRAALYALIEFGIKKHGWIKVYLPSFYCHEVTDYIKSLSIEIINYTYNPLNDIKVEVFDTGPSVIVKVDYFGFGISRNIHINQENTLVIEDLTHNLSGIKNSTSDYGFASLRKELPIPTGGLIFSNKNKELPKGSLNTVANDIAQRKLTAMHLKTMYLENKFSDKPFFRTLFLDAEVDFESSLANAINPELSNAIINGLNISKILKVKKDNLKLILDQLVVDENFTILNTYANLGFGLVLKAKTQKQRNNLKDYLIKNLIFPAILWPHQYEEIDVALENTILFIHSDFRYNKNQITQICQKINLFFNN
ncbi:hypothetical protein ACFQ1Q_04825 [Winogradskyella litorisediminis]|uniref:dTDP-4-amino-4,6-dideoxygalactose transaminase n=1 Tax=Winogradskyella litorisediminis TaxID=1156618 RepID=A0ABW3N8I9_9FLAO